MVWVEQDSGATRSRSLTAILLAAGVLCAAVALRSAWPRVLLPTLAAVVLLVWVDRRQAAVLASRWLWLGLLILVVVPVWLLGTRHAGRTVADARHASALFAGLCMAARVLCVMSFMLLLGACLPAHRVARAVGRVAGKDVGLACGIAVNLLPGIIEIIRRTTLALRLRGGLQWWRPRGLRRLFVTVGVQAVRLTEDVAEALVLSQAAREHGTGDSTDARGQP